MASPQPPNDPPHGSGSAFGGPSSSKAAGGSGSGASQGNGQAQPIADIFGTDMGPAAMVLVLLLLGLVQASFNRCIC